MMSLNMLSRIFEDSVMKAIVDDIKIGQQFGHINSNMNIDFAGNVILRRCFTNLIFLLCS
jgi:hypothetical protein